MSIARYPKTQSIGVTGVVHYGKRSRVEDEWHPNLRGGLAAKVYREIYDNDSIVGGSMALVKNFVRQVQWKAKRPHDGAGARRSEELLNTAMHDMEMTWTSFISSVLTMLPYGWAGFEKVYKVRGGQSDDVDFRSRHSDNAIGWRGFFIRSQETLKFWQWDEEDRVTGMWQQVYQVQPQPVFIPIEKLVLFRTEDNRGNPEGRSLLRNVYRAWWFLKRIQELEAIGIERDLAGLPVILLPIEYWSDPTKIAKRQQYERLVQQIRRNDHEGAVFPAEDGPNGKTGFMLKLLSSGGTRAVNAREVIRGLQREIAINFNTQVQQLGSDGVGSYALSSDQTNTFTVGLGAVLGNIKDTLNNDPVVELQDLNGVHPDDRSIIVHSDVEKPDIDKVASAMQRLSISGHLTPDRGSEQFGRDLIGIPPKEDDGSEDDAHADAAEGEIAQQMAEEMVDEGVPSVKCAVPPAVIKVAKRFLDGMADVPEVARTKRVSAIARARALASGSLTPNQLAAVRAYHEANPGDPREGSKTWQVYQAHGGKEGRDWVSTHLRLVSG